MGKARDLATLLNSSGQVPLGTKVAGVLPDGNAPSGSVIQVVFAQKKDTQTITANAGITEISGLSASITPVSVNSKILVQTYIVCASTNGASLASGFLLYRNGSNIDDSTANAAGSRPRVWIRNDSFAGISSWGSLNADHGPSMLSGFYLDSPASASSLTYSVRLRPQTNSANFLINRTGNDSDVNDMWGSRPTSGLILMEIA
jgi:hypothetical protein